MIFSYYIGKYIACGCNGAVYELKLRQSQHGGNANVINHKTDTFNVSQ